MIQQVFEALPVETPALAYSVRPLHQDLHRPTVELLNPDRIPFHSIVVVVPTELPVQLREENVESNVAIRKVIGAGPAKLQLSGSWVLANRTRLERCDCKNCRTGPSFCSVTRLVQDYLGHRNIAHTVQYTRTAASRFE
jgi:hypothetical protein